MFQELSLSSYFTEEKNLQESPSKIHTAVCIVNRYTSDSANLDIQRSQAFQGLKCREIRGVSRFEMPRHAKRKGICLSFFRGR